MANWNGLILTDAGRELQAKVEAGQTLLTFTKMKLGNGVLAEGQSLETLKDLISPKQIIGINTCMPHKNGLCTVNGVIINTGLSIGYELRELGLYALSPDGGNDILYAVTTDNHPDYLHPEGGATIVSEEFNLNIAISNTDKVTAVINLSGLATIGNINTLIDIHNQSESAHENQIATQAEAEAGTDNTKRMTPLRVMQLIVKKVVNMTGATSSAAGKSGLVPAPEAGSQATKYLRADGTWQVPDERLILQRNKAYAVGDIAYHKDLPSWARLECVQAGTTGDTIDFTQISSGGGI